MTGSKTALLICDNKEYADEVSADLKTHGYNVQRVVTLDEAVALLSDPMVYDDYNVVALDPGIGGRTNGKAVSELRAANIATPVVLVTPTASDMDAAEQARSGVYGVISPEEAAHGANPGYMADKATVQYKFMQYMINEAVGRALQTRKKDLMDHILHHLNLDDEDAAEDIKLMRGTIRAIMSLKNSIIHSVGKLVALGLLGVLITGFWSAVDKHIEQKRVEDLRRQRIEQQYQRDHAQDHQPEHEGHTGP